MIVMGLVGINLCSKDLTPILPFNPMPFPCKFFEILFLVQEALVQTHLYCGQTLSTCLDKAIKILGFVFHFGCMEPLVVISFDRDRYKIHQVWYGPEKLQKSSHDTRDL